MLRLHRHHRNKAPQGFSLVELLVAVAILSIIAGYAAPAVTRMLATNRIAMQTNEFSASLKQARAEAVRRAQPITLRASNSPDLGDFARSGWTVITDQNADGAPAIPVTDADGTTIREAGGPGNSVAIVRVDRSGSAGAFSYAATALDDDEKRAVIFNARGAHAAGADAFFRICDTGSTGVSGRVLRVSVVGSVTLC
jgi:type IV fimbrial biogenesis protein FimT